MSKLFLDDMRPAPSGWDLVRSYQEFVDYVDKLGVPQVISFDHDLGFEHYPFGEQDPTERIPYEQYTEKTGYHCAQYLVGKGQFPETAIVHSFNIVGARNIAHLLGRHCEVIVAPYRSEAARGT
jgi:hypothetical protein